MHIHLWCFLFFFVITGKPAYNSDIQDGICRSCASGGLSTSCYCDDMCAFYKDCCFDAAAESTKRFIQTDVPISCLPMSFRRSIYVVDGCISSWDGPPTVKMKCEEKNDLSDMFISIPVTDTKTNITYTNRYCAECNHADPSTRSSFSVKLSCDYVLQEVNNSYGNITEDFMLRNLVYYDYSWGVFHWDQRVGNISFLHCSLLHEIPENLSPSLRDCQSSVISTCAHNWNDDLTQQCCISFNMNIVYDIYGIAYRNAYCAICNHIPVNETKCKSPITFDETPVTVHFTPAPSFVLLLDISSLNDKPQCSRTEIYDSISKKCRRLICTNPDEAPTYGKCTKTTK